MNVLFVFLSALFFCSDLIASNIQINGFLTAGTAINNSHVKYDNEIDGKFNYFYDTKVGLNFNSDISNKWHVGFQILSAYDTVDQNYKLNADWAFATFKPVKGLSMYFGQQKTPLWLISDYKSVGFLYPWVRPPLEVYQLGPVETYYGTKISYVYDFSLINAEAQFYAGKSKAQLRVLAVVDNPVATAAINTALQANYSTPFCLSSILTGSSDLLGFNTSIYNDFMIVKASLLYLPNASIITGNTPFNMSYTFWGLASKLTYKAAFLYTEYAHGDIKEKDLSSSPSVLNGKVSAFYTTVGYKLPFVTPHFTFAHCSSLDNGAYFAGIPLHSPYRDGQKSFIFGVVTRTSDYSDFKIEYQRIYANTYGLFTTALPMGKAINMLSLAFDLIF